jgi:proteasome assembly chaperone (PAC2) family protein
MELNIKFLKKLRVSNGTAIAGSAGLRSSGLLAINHLIKELKPEKIAELYSSNFPVAYYGIPYAGTIGEGGVMVEKDLAELPRVEFYHKDNYVIVKGYHADIFGQYIVARKSVELLVDIGVAEIISLGGYVPVEPRPLTEKRRVSYCTNDPELIKSKKMEKLGIEKKEPGPFLGFSGLIIGEGQKKGIKCIGLFGETEAITEDPLYPDPLAAKALLEKLSRFLNLPMDIEGLISRGQPSVERSYV